MQERTRLEVWMIVPYCIQYVQTACQSDTLQRLCLITIVRYCFRIDISTNIVERSLTNSNVIEYTWDPQVNIIWRGYPDNGRGKYLGGERWN